MCFLKMTTVSLIFFALLQGDFATPPIRGRVHFPTPLNLCESYDCFNQQRTRKSNTAQILVIALNQPQGFCFLSLKSQSPWPPQKPQSCEAVLENEAPGWGLWELRIPKAPNEPSGMNSSNQPNPLVPHE